MIIQSQNNLRPVNIALLVFLISLIAYGWVGFLWLIYDASFVSGGNIFAEASKIQTVAFLSVFGALLTSMASFVFETKNV